ncbi:MAG TPA: hypothetical protein VM619_13235 [Luteimonas sp.]|nr:hypothetical protein [Luteimonas sp.]
MLRKQVAPTARAIALAFVSCLMLSGCLSTKMYVDPALPTVAKADIQPAAEPRPVQLLFEFRTKGNANAKATAEIRPRVVAAAAESGLFSTVSQAPADGGVLTVTIDNIVLDDAAMAKGFGTGLTFGLVGSMVTDGYVCTASYSRDGITTQAEVKHAIHTTIGNHAAPEGLTPMEPQAAVHKAMDQIAWNLLKQLSAKHAFD